MKHLQIVLFIVCTQLFSQTATTKTLGEFSELKVYDLINTELIKASENKIVVSGNNSENISIVQKNGTLKIISFYAKKARGMMTRFIIQNRIKNIDEIKNFNLGGYVFSESLTNSKEWVFTR